MFKSTPLALLTRWGEVWGEVGVRSSPVHSYGVHASLLFGCRTSIPRAIGGRSECHKSVVTACLIDLDHNAEKIVAENNVLADY